MIPWDTLSERERDALVAEKVVGYVVTGPREGGNVRWVQPPAGEQWQSGGERVLEKTCPRYTTDIAAAWEVIEKMKSLGWQVLMDNKNEIDEPGWWVCFEQWEPRQRHASVFMRTAPAAICYAALSALEKAA